MGGPTISGLYPIHLGVGSYLRIDDAGFPEFPLHRKVFSRIKKPA